jgi:hypothetical protein
MASTSGSCAYESTAARLSRRAPRASTSGVDRSASPAGTGSNRSSATSGSACARVAVASATEAARTRCSAWSRKAVVYPPGAVDRNVAHLAGAVARAGPHAGDRGGLGPRGRAAGRGRQRTDDAGDGRGQHRGADGSHRFTLSPRAGPHRGRGRGHRPRVDQRDVRRGAAAQPRRGAARDAAHAGAQRAAGVRRRRDHGRGARGRSRRRPLGRQPLDAPADGPGHARGRSVRCRFC